MNASRSFKLPSLTSVLASLLHPTCCDIHGLSWPYPSATARHVLALHRHCTVLQLNKVKMLTSRCPFQFQSHFFTQSIDKGGCDQVSRTCLPCRLSRASKSPACSIGIERWTIRLFRCSCSSTCRGKKRRVGLLPARKRKSSSLRRTSSVCAHACDSSDS
jgi:hypothetical protein